MKSEHNYIAINKETWNKFNMEDITDYGIEGNEGVLDGK
jgi:hypothetical protein